MLISTLIFIGLLSIFVYSCLWKKEYGLQVIIFTIPISSTYVPLSGYWQSFPISLTGILVVFFYILTFSRRNFKWHNSYFKCLFYILLFNLVWGMIFTFFYSDDVVRLSNYWGDTQTQLGLLKPAFQVIYHSSNLVICILFLNILRKYFQVQKNIENAAYVFSLSIFLMFSTQLLEIFGIREIRPVYPDDPSYMGLFSMFGFGIYIAMVIAFSLLFKFSHYRIIIITAFLYGLFSCERQAIILPVTVLFIYFLLSSGNILKKVTLILIFGTSLYFLLYVFKTEFHGVVKLWDAINMSKETSLLEATDRGINDFILKKLQQAVIEWPITGKGLYNWGYFIGIDTEFANHVIWINYYQKFGLFGILIFITAIFYFTFVLIKFYILRKNDRNLVIGLGLMIAFIGQQFLDNFFWFTNTMLLYIFMFSFIFSVMHKNKTDSSS